MQRDSTTASHGDEIVVDRRNTRERGAVAVETAIMVPILFFLFFGIVEFGLFWQSDHTINEASRSGARLGATLARELDYEEDIVAAVESSIGNNIPSGDVKYLTIYKADPSTGDPVTGDVLTCSVDCWRFVWDESDREFDLVVGPTWVASEQAACGETGHNDYMGVYVEGEYSSVTGMFGSTRKISESS